MAVKDLEAQISALRKVLEYYADERVYTAISTGSPFVMVDGGKRARDVLAEWR